MYYVFKLLCLETLIDFSNDLMDLKTVYVLYSIRIDLIVQMIMSYIVFYVCIFIYVETMKEWDDIYF